MAELVAAIAEGMQESGMPLPVGVETMFLWQSVKVSMLLCMLANQRGDTR